MKNIITEVLHFLNDDTSHFCGFRRHICLWKITKLQNRNASTHFCGFESHVYWWKTTNLQNRDALAHFTVTKVVFTLGKLQNCKMYSQHIFLWL